MDTTNQSQYNSSNVTDDKKNDEGDCGCGSGCGCEEKEE